MLTDEGAAFSDRYYSGSPGYLGDWEATFGAAANDYSVPDTWETYERIAPLLDSRYEAWVGESDPLAADDRADRSSCGERIRHGWSARAMQDIRFGCTRGWLVRLFHWRAATEGPGL